MLRKAQQVNSSKQLKTAQNSSKQLKTAHNSSQQLTTAQQLTTVRLQISKRLQAFKFDMYLNRRQNRSKKSKKI